MVAICWHLELRPGSTRDRLRPVRHSPLRDGVDSFEGTLGFRLHYVAVK